MAIVLPSAQLAATVALNLSIAAVVGASLSSTWLHKGASLWAARHVAGLRVAILAATGAAIVSYIALLWLEAASMAEVPIGDAAPAVQAALTATHYGHAWTMGICSLIIIAAVTSVPWPREHGPAAAWVRLLAIGVFLYCRSIVSHAGAGGDVSWAVAADWLHFVLISVWVGEVLVSGLVTLRMPAGVAPDERLDRARYVQALSNSATVALVGILISGLLSAWRGLGSFDNATGNPYATTLLIKLALVGSAALLGGINRFHVMPGLLDHLRGTAGESNRSERTFAAILQVEIIFLMTALVMAAILSSTSPPTAG